MIIEREKREKEVFGNLTPGKCFETNGDFYMRIARYDVPSESLSAVRLSNGEICHFSLDCPVRFVEIRAKVVE